MLIYDGECRYKTEIGAPARCRLRVYETAKGLVAIATELHNNPGTCITYRAETLATQVLRSFDGDPAHFAWIEHWQRRPGLDETFDRVTFVWDTNQWDGKHRDGYTMPHWARIDRRMVEALVGEPLEADRVKTAA